MESLYKINQQIFELLENETADNSEEIAKELESYILTRDTKIENIALYFKNLKAEIEALKVEEGSLKERRKFKENKKESIENYLMQSMLMIAKDKFETPRVKITVKTTERVVEDMSVLSKEWMREKITVEANKELIKKALKSGEIIEGAVLERFELLQIK